MRLLGILLVAVWVLSGCATFKPVPEGYSGPVSHIKDSVTTLGSSGADFFYVSKFNGKGIDNSMSRSRAASYGQGFRMTAVAIGRDVPTSPTTITIMGRRDFAAPIQALFSKIYEVSGDIAFLPAPDKTYVVKGELGESHSSVWLEEETTGVLIGQKIEVKGSTALGVLEK